MSFVDGENCYLRTTIVIDSFDDGAQDLIQNETTTIWPPCQTGGCRASSHDQEHCEFDPKSGLCAGRMA